MSFVRGSVGIESVQKFLDVLQADFKTLAQDTKKKYPHIKESCEEAIIKLNSASINQHSSIYYTVNQILYPLVQGCETKDLKTVRFCLGMMQRLITQQVVDQKGARYITDALWMLMENNLEEVKVLQTVILLLTTNSIVRGETLAKALVLCFRLHFTKDSTIINTAGATIRQLVSLVFERVIAERENRLDINTTGQNYHNYNQQHHQHQQQHTQSSSQQQHQQQQQQHQQQQHQHQQHQQHYGISDVSVSGKQDNKLELQPCEMDAFFLFQDLVQLVNADQPYWLLGMTEMTRTFGLELLETILTNFSEIFFDNADFTVLLKERVCALVIKLFSPNVKHRTVTPSNVQVESNVDKPYFPISMRLLRLVSILIQKYHSILVTECEIFLSLIVKFLDPDKPNWQRALALEVIHKMVNKPNLLVSFCKFYDLKDHATNILQDVINSLGAYVQSLLINSQLCMASNSSMNAQTHSSNSSSNSMSGNSSISQQGFIFRGAWFPLTMTFPRGQTKSVYLEMLEKMEPPNIPDGYCISIAYASLLDIVQSIECVIKGSAIINKDVPAKGKEAEDIKLLHSQLINSSWCGLLSALIPLIEASIDEVTTENILKAMEDFAGLCGILELNTPRDSFIIAICRASLPPHYGLAILNTGCQGLVYRCHSRSNSQDLNGQFSGTCNETDFRQQVIAVGTPLPTSSLPAGAQQGPVMLTAKNLQCMRALLHVAHYHGGILGTSWHIVLATLQHLVWILGLKPSTGGSLQAAPKLTTDTTNMGIQTAVMADLPVLSQMLSQLFESSQYLDDVALHHLIDALCKLSQEAMELAYTNREPSLFAVAKLLETGLVNLPRVEVLWRPLTTHLLEVCQHRHIRMREWGVEAITYLVKAALQFKYKTPLKDNMNLQTLLLSPLTQLSAVPHGDVRQRQLECVLQILNGAGEILSYGWPSILGIIGAVSDLHGEALIRIAFQCLQLVVTDFLPVMPSRCLPLCINTTAKFGSQVQELNISLTAIGLMWNISDFFNQNQEKLMHAAVEDFVIMPDFPGTVDMPQFDKLWMCLYAKLAELCVDLRPAVRKSAGQTLFSTISAHGSLLNPPTWRAVLWQVLFPLLDKVRNLSSCASSEKVDTSGNILIHHSRNTAQKQWAETQVLTLSGVCKVFNAKRELLQSIGNFSQAWTLLLEFIEDAALNKNNEVSLSALKCLQEILYNNIDKKLQQQRLQQLQQQQQQKIDTKNDNSNSTSTGTTKINSNAGGGDLWTIAWRIWLNIGEQSIKLPSQNGTGGDTGDVDMNNDECYFPSQPFLTALAQIFPVLFQNISEKFTRDDLQRLCSVLLNAVTIPIHADSTPYIITTSNSDSILIPLHDAVLECMELIQKESIINSSSHLREMVPDIFRQLLIFTKFSCMPPTINSNYIGAGNYETIMSTKSKYHHHHHHSHSQINSGPTIELITMNYTAFGEKALNIIVKLYQETATDEIVIKENILHEIIKTLHVPLSLKYKCISSSTWKLAISSLLTILRIGLKVIRETTPVHNQTMAMWDDLYDTLDKFLFPSSICSIEDRGLEEIVMDENIDCQVIELLRDEILPYSNSVPRQFMLNVVVLLNKGSIHSASNSNIGSESDWKLREIFAKICFETLLQFSLWGDDNNYCSTTNNNNNNNNSNNSNNCNKLNNNNNNLDENTVGTTMDTTTTTISITNQQNNKLINNESGGFAGRLAITALLHRFQEVLKRFNEDERQSGKCPLPRYRLSEISFVLKAVATLIISMKKASSCRVNKTAWDQLIGLYPYLVDCTTTTSPEVSRSLREALLQYAELLQPPNYLTTTETATKDSNHHHHHHHHQNQNQHQHHNVMTTTTNDRNDETNC